MRKRTSGFGKPKLRRREPREVECPTAAPEPLGGSPEPVFCDDSEVAGGWQSRPDGNVVPSPAGPRRRQGKGVSFPSEYVPRLVVSDRHWARVLSFLSDQRRGPGRKPKNLSRTFEGILWIFRTGAPWRDLPRFFGKWNNVYRAFKRMRDRGVFILMFMSLAKELDLTVVMVDGSFVKVRQHAVGARRGERDPAESRVAQVIGKTKGGLNTNLLALTDKNGRLVRFSLLPGNAF